MSEGARPEPAPRAPNALHVDDGGFPAEPVDAVLQPHFAIIERVKLAFGLDTGSFERTVMPIVTRYAEFVHLLPCTADNYFKARGDLLRIGLETAFFALQGTDAHIFAGRATISERRRLEPQWRLATFIAGLCAELHRPLCRMTVMAADGSRWSPYVASLAQWLRARGLRRYFLRWRLDAFETRPPALFALRHVVPAEVLEELSGSDTSIVRQLLAAVSGVNDFREHNALEALTRRALALVIDRDLVAAAQRDGKRISGLHVERLLLDVMRRLAAGNVTWTPNAEKSRVWYGSDGMFLVWPSAAEDVRRVLEADALAGLPMSAEAMLQAMLDAGALTLQTDGAAVWTIHPLGSRSPMNALKLRSPFVLYPESAGTPTALSVTLASPEPTTQAKHPEHAKPVVTRAATSDVASATHIDVCAAAGESSVQDEQVPLAESECVSSESGPIVPQDDLQPLPPEPATRQGAVLVAPLRLPVAVRSALEQILQGSPEGRASEAVGSDEGVFVPLSALTARHLAAPAIVRALSDCGMLVGDAMVERSVRGESMNGVLIDRRHVHGRLASDEI